MGRGDKKSRKGKIFRGSSGNSRLKVKHPTNPLSQPDPSKISVKTDSIKKLADAKPAPSERKPAAEKKPADKKPAERKPATDKKPAK
jgi:ribosomal small subunit protein bTHX